MVCCMAGRLWEINGKIYRSQKRELKGGWEYHENLIFGGNLNSKLYKWDVLKLVGVLSHTHHKWWWLLVKVSKGNASQCTQTDELQVVLCIWLPKPVFCLFFSFVCHKRWCWCLVSHGLGNILISSDLANCCITYLLTDVCWCYTHSNAKTLTSDLLAILWKYDNCMLVVQLRLVL